ncbi:YALI0F17468p [Yarrowia lipolytica CLIB122]|uniref:YALI0F17468p n=1 Tax=Yarrowia lipolytica (strain CLIB 122 / E 150) TaxID=284591 RepID=Q6C1C5_YARLI|nr:YALI0F17468p [Yarrowia lipolytica CLIB122]CAG78346.1 YALI0F17468p [Yarrowia lipolytica CLIB122]|eukprot:XP_505537.1 YALI0F17468p [Yarrowia lipolytica CLIB122]
MNDFEDDQKHKARTEPSGQPPKKRSRVTFSCLICRKRKMKCDRNLPCSTCKAANAAHLCRYDMNRSASPQDRDMPIPSDESMVAPTSAPGGGSAANSGSKKPRGRPKKSVAELTKMHQQLLEQNELKGETKELKDVVKQEFQSLPPQQQQHIPQQQQQQQHQQQQTMRHVPQQQQQHMPQQAHQQQQFHALNQHQHQHLQQQHHAQQHHKPNGLTINTNDPATPVNQAVRKSSAASATPGRTPPNENSPRRGSAKKHLPPIGDTPSPSMSSPSSAFKSSADMLHQVVTRTATDTKYIGISSKFSLCMKPARQQLFGPFSSMSFFSENEHLQRFSKQVYEAKKQNYIKDKNAPVLMRHKNIFTDLPQKYRVGRGSFVGAGSHYGGTSAPGSTNSHANGGGAFNAAASPMDKTPASTSSSCSTMDCGDISKSFPFDSPNGIYEVLELVPPKPLTYFLVDKYMNSVNRFFYTVIPKSFYECLDEFFIQKQRILNREIPATVKTVDLRQVAQILLILRLARITLPFDWVVPEYLVGGNSNSTTGGSNNDGSSASSPPASADTSDVYLGAGLSQIAENCLNHIGYLRKANLRVLQVLCLLKITAMCDPDAGDSADGCDSCNLTGLIIQISISMGLHMDPSHFSKVSPTIAHLWRMLFGFIVTLDAHRSMELALPPSLPLECSDTDILFERHSLPDDLLSPGEEQHIYHRRKQLRWAFISLDVVRGLLRTTVHVTPDGMGTSPQAMGKEYFDAIERKLEAFENDMNPYYEEILSALQAPESRDSDYRTVDGHAAAQRLSLYMTLVRLRLGYYLCAGNFMDAAEVKTKVVTCALKMCDIMQAAMERPHLFSGFMWYVHFVNLRNFTFSFGTCISAYLNEINTRRAERDMPIITPAVNRKYNDMTFDYSPDKIRDPKRLIQAAIRTHRWVRSLSQRYYVAWKCHAVIVGLLRGARLEVLAQYIDAQEYKRLEKEGHRDNTFVGPYAPQMREPTTMSVTKNDWGRDITSENYDREQSELRAAEERANRQGQGPESMSAPAAQSQDQIGQGNQQQQMEWQGDNNMFQNNGLMEPPFLEDPIIDDPTFDTLGSTLGLPSLIAEEWANIEDSLFDDLNSSRFYMSMDQNFNNTSTATDNYEVTSPSR